MNIYTTSNQDEILQNINSGISYREISQKFQVCEKTIYNIKKRSLIKPNTNINNSKSNINNSKSNINNSKSNINNSKSNINNSKSNKKITKKEKETQQLIDAFNGTVSTPSNSPRDRQQLNIISIKDQIPYLFQRKKF